MSMSENLMNTIRALPVADKQTLLDLLTADLKRETSGDDTINQPHEQNTTNEEQAGVNADRVLGMWRNRFDEAETSGEIASRWRRELWQR